MSRTSNRLVALIFLSIAQLLLVFNGAILNVALPSAQHDLDIGDGGRQWIITSYTLIFGGLLLLGGRLGDLYGRKRIFLAGLTGFILASAIGGAATTAWVLFAARALQGLFGALLAPAALSLISLSFPGGKERAKAFGLFSAITTSGGAIGLLLGGVLTDYLSWRWALFINIPLGLIPVLGAWAYVEKDPRTRSATRLDIPGTVLATVGLVALVLGFSEANSRGWGDGVTVGALALGLILLTAFAVVQARTRDPLLPPRVLTERNRAGAYLSATMGLLSLFAVTLFLTYYLQVVKGYSPALTGLAFLPVAVAQVIGASALGTWLMTRLSARTVMVGGYLLGAVSVLLMTLLRVDTPYAPTLLLAELGLGLGVGAALLPATSLATYGIGPADAGVASAMINISQQVGGSIGVALLNTIATSATAGYLSARAAADQNDALVQGYQTAYLWAAAFLVAAAVVSLLLVTGRQSAAAPETSERASLERAGSR
ncbi:MFS transporter [Actinoplanes sp. CA-054009]